MELGPCVSREAEEVPLYDGVLSVPGECAAEHVPHCGVSPSDEGGFKSITKRIIKGMAKNMGVCVL